MGVFHGSKSHGTVYNIQYIPEEYKFEIVINKYTSLFATKLGSVIFLEICRATVVIDPPCDDVRPRDTFIFMFETATPRSD